MTKLTDWLSFIFAFLSIWISIVFGYIQSSFFDRWMFFIKYSPLILIGLFGLYSIFVITYRILTFNDCEYAAQELQEQMIECKESLKSKGYKFDD